MGLYITMYDLIRRYYNNNISITRSIPLTYFYDIEEVKENLIKLVVKTVHDFIGDGIYGYAEDYTSISLFLYSFNDDRAFSKCNRIMNIEYDSKDSSNVIINLCDFFLEYNNINKEEFIKIINMEIKLNDELADIIDNLKFTIE